ncbi:MAG TPA: hypothetical protein VK325_03350 [Pseudoxanthomonas sp.]|nr:hypothetical protein [Pseudoxanthomonas sp.]
MNDDAQDAVAPILLLTGLLEALAFRAAAADLGGPGGDASGQRAGGGQVQALDGGAIPGPAATAGGGAAPEVAWAWKIIAVLASLSVLLLVGYWLLIKQADARLRAAQARADAIEVKAEVLEASRQVEITSCGGRPCIRIDRNTPTWRSKGSEYILV